MKYLVAIGETNKSEFEFGEFIHLATAILVYPKLRYIFVGDLENPLHLGCYNFITKFKKPSVLFNYEKYSKKGKNFPIGKTADIFKEFYKELIHDKFNDIINENSSSLNEINEYIQKLKLDKKNKYAFIWIRNGMYQPNRNITKEGVIQLNDQLAKQKIIPILIGSDLDTGLTNIPNLQSYFLNPLFKNNIFNQLILLRELINQYHIKFSIGLKSGGMDAPTLVFRLPCIYFGEKNRNRRMDKVGATIKQFKFIPFQNQNSKEFISFTEQELKTTRKIVREIK
ncbi:hypothetical protein [Leptospira vanthielii]|uniref:Uncharacterized protein n=1 Tax=Leptospira vanthielii serovar Holland str. Waz Holland = ATCC 700522 TaxID=1218591 RepID=N1VV05_9LEPT|nr:hypothetical protein [Leptospira vanthielii]EMY67764.1 hypothetical protein LEP1GSC199_1002 [Leptospira vanthielii serovar Holland str. Waz Holland = ATCC 700522]